MSLTRIAATVLRQYYLMRGSPTRFVSIFIWVGLDILLWGFFTKYLSGVATADFPFVPTLLGAVLLWSFCQRMMHGVTMAFFEDVWARNFLNMFASPIRVGEYLAALVCTSIATSLLALSLMLVLAIGAFGLGVFAYGVAIIPFLMILFMFGLAIGIFGCSLLMLKGPAAEWLIWPIPALLSPLACVLYPLAILPGWMQALAHGLPLAYVFENIRTIMRGGQADMGELAIGIALAGGYILLACGAFTYAYRKAVRTGLIARYSAESVA